MCKFIGKSNERILYKLSKRWNFKVVFNRSCCHGNYENVTFYCQARSFISIFFTCQVPACELQPFLLPWFGKWHILTNCQNCVQPPYYPFFKVMRKRKKKYEVKIRFSKLSENDKVARVFNLNWEGVFLLPQPEDRVFVPAEAEVEAILKLLSIIKQLLPF